MLTNPTTHIRNIAGNSVFVLQRNLKNVIGSVFEPAAVKNKAERTKSVLNPLSKADTALKDYAQSQYAADQESAMGMGKYSDRSKTMREIQDKRKIWGKSPVQKITDLNTGALDAEDVWFNRPAYTQSFAEALKAKGVSAEDIANGTKTDIVETARAYAIKEAQKATYRDSNEFSDWVSGIGKYHGENKFAKSASVAMDAELPFRRTPANILARGAFEYSPLGFAKAVTYDAVQVKRGKMDASEMVDHLSSGLAGVGIFGLGAFLNAQQLLVLKPGGDDDKKEGFLKSLGAQDFSLQIGDKSYTVDWLSPFAMPLFAGAAMYQAWENGGGFFGSFLSASASITDALLQTSMLSSIDDMLDNISYAQSKPWYVVSRTLTSYLSQAVPTLGGKIASAADDTVRKAFTQSGESEVVSDADYFKQSIMKKIPGARNQLQPMVDLWGNEKSNGDLAQRLIQSFASPGYYSKIDTSSLAKELTRLGDTLGNSTIYPSAASKTFNYTPADGGESKSINLTADQYTKYAKSLGKTRYSLLNEAVSSDYYRSMSDTEKADYISSVYAYSNAMAKESIVGHTSKDAWLDEATAAKSTLGVSTAAYIALHEKYGASLVGTKLEKVKTAVASGVPIDEYMSIKGSLDVNGNGSVSQSEAQTVLNKSDLSKQQKDVLWVAISKAWKANPYK